MKKGKIWKFGDNIDTDQIIPSQYVLLSGVEEMKEFTFEPLDKNFVKNFIPGDVIVAGNNFGCGSSREQAPMVLKAIEVGLVLAKSFARIFFRNSINIGLPLLICPELSDDSLNGNYLSYSLQENEIIYNERDYKYEKFPKHILEIINAGGLINYINNK